MRIVTSEYRLLFDSQGENELAAYELAREHFRSIVPQTFPYLAGQRLGCKQITPKAVSAQELSGDLYDEVRVSDTLADLAAIICLDLVLGVVDRDGGSWGLLDSGRLYAYGQPGRAAIALSDALGPVRLCRLEDDPLYSALLIERLANMLSVISKRSLAPAELVSSWLRDLSSWLRNLRERGMIAVDAYRG